MLCECRSSLLAYKLEVDAVDDRSHAKDEREEAGEDHHRITRQEEVVSFIGWKIRANDATSVDAIMGHSLVKAGSTFSGKSYKCPPHSSLCTHKFSHRLQRQPLSSRCVHGCQTESALKRKKTPHIRSDDASAHTHTHRETHTVCFHLPQCAKHTVTNHYVEVITVWQLMVAYSLQIDGFQIEVGAH